MFLDLRLHPGLLVAQLSVPVLFLLLQYTVLGSLHPRPPKPDRKRLPETLSMALLMAFPAAAYLLVHKPWMQLSLFIYGFFLVSEVVYVWWPAVQQKLRAPAAVATEGAAGGSEQNAMGASPSWGQALLAGALVVALLLSWQSLSGTPDSACIFCVKEIGG